MVEARSSLALPVLGGPNRNDGFVDVPMIWLAQACSGLPGTFADLRHLDRKTRSLRLPVSYGSGDQTPWPVTKATGTVSTSDIVSHRQLRGTG
jgi:hypothetical protein